MQPPFRSLPSALLFVFLFSCAMVLVFVGIALFGAIEAINLPDLFCVVRCDYIADAYSQIRLVSSTSLFCDWCVIYIFSYKSYQILSQGIMF
jgi:hypothetical protein